MSVISYDDLLTKNIALIERICKKSASEQSRFVEDLELDSIDLAGLMSEMEDEFGVLIPEERLHMLRTVGAATHCVHELLSKGERVA